MYRCPNVCWEVLWNTKEMSTNVYRYLQTPTCNLWTDEMSSTGGPGASFPWAALSLLIPDGGRVTHVHADDHLHSVIWCFPQEGWTWTIFPLPIVPVLCDLVAKALCRMSIVWGAPGVITSCGTATKCSVHPWGSRAASAQGLDVSSSIDAARCVKEALPAAAEASRFTPEHNRLPHVFYSAGDAAASLRALRNVSTLSSS